MVAATVRNYECNLVRFALDWAIQQNHRSRTRKSSQSSSLAGNFRRVTQKWWYWQSITNCSTNTIIGSNLVVSLHSENSMLLPLWTIWIARCPLDSIEPRSFEPIAGSARNRLESRYQTYSTPTYGLRRTLIIGLSMAYLDERIRVIECYMISIMPLMKIVHLWSEVQSTDDFY